MPTYDVTAAQLGARLEAGHEDRGEAMRDACFRAALRGMPLVVSDTPVDTGNTRAAWDVRPTQDGADLYNDSPIAGVLEAGSRPHRPPFMPILRWVVRKFGLDMSGPKSAKQSFSDLDDVPEHTKRIAWSVVETIAEEGTKPHWMVRDNLGDLETLLKQETEKALGS